MRVYNSAVSKAPELKVDNLDRYDRMSAEMQGERYREQLRRQLDAHARRWLTLCDGECGRDSVGRDYLAGSNVCKTERFSLWVSMGFGPEAAARAANRRVITNLAVQGLAAALYRRVEVLETEGGRRRVADLFERSCTETTELLDAYLTDENFTLEP